jgi:hypothetical protein
MSTLTKTRQQTVPTTTLVIDHHQDYTLLEENFRLVRYVIFDKLRENKNSTNFGRVHNTLREKIDYPYKSFFYDRLDGVTKWVVYVLYPRNAQVNDLILTWFDNMPLPWREIAFEKAPLHIIVKLLQIRLFRGEESTRFIGQDRCYVYARSGGEDFHYCVEIELKEARTHKEDAATQEFRIIPHAKRFGKIKPPFQPSRALFGKRPVGNKYFFLHLKPGAEAQESAVYDIVTFSGKRAQVKYHNLRDLDASRGKIVFDFVQQFLMSLKELGITAHIKERTFTLASTQKNVDLSVQILNTVGVYDNRLQRTHALAAYVELLNGIHLNINFVALEDIENAPHGGVLVLLDVKAEDFEEDGMLSGTIQKDPYERLYREHSDIPKQSLNVNLNDPNALEGRDYLDYPMIQPDNKDFAQKIRAVLSELYLKCALLRGITHFPLLFIPNDLAFIRKARYSGEPFTTALWFEENELRFVNLGNPTQQPEAFYQLLDRWGVDWDEQYDKLHKERQRFEENGTRKDLPTFDIIVGQDLFVAIEDLEERVLYNYNEIERRHRDQKTAYTITELKLAPYYDEIKKSTMLKLSELSQQGLLDRSHLPTTTTAQQSLVFYRQLLEYDAFLDEISITHPKLSYQELTSGEWLERICCTFGGKADEEGKYDRKIIARLYKNRGMFLTERGENVQLYQGIWYDDTNAFLVGSPTSMDLKGQEHAHLIRRFQIMQGTTHFDKEQLLSTMGVLFVRPKQYTVSPYYFHLIDLYVENILRYASLEKPH